MFHIQRYERVSDADQGWATVLETRTRELGVTGVKSLASKRPTEDFRLIEVILEITPIVQEVVEDKPESGKVYSLLKVSQTGKWKGSEV